MIGTYFTMVLKGFVKMFVIRINSLESQYVFYTAWGSIGNQDLV